MRPTDFAIKKNPKPKPTSRILAASNEQIRCERTKVLLYVVLEKEIK